MGILGWIVFGLIVGVVAKFLTPGRDPGGFIVTILIGIVGALLGGFIGRKGDGEPGITTIWRGWSRLTDMANMYLIMHPSEDTGNS